MRRVVSSHKNEYDATKERAFLRQTFTRQGRGDSGCQYVLRCSREDVGYRNNIFKHFGVNVCIILFLLLFFVRALSLSKRINISYYSHDFVQFMKPEFYYSTKRISR